MSSLPSRYLRQRLSFETLECRITPAGDLQPIVVPDWEGSYQIYGPTILNLFTEAVDPNEGGVLDFSQIRIMQEPTKGQVVVDPNTGTFAYTPNYLLPSGLPKGEEPTEILPEFFKFRITDNLGAMSNIATARFNGGVAPMKAGNLIAHDSGAVIKTLQPAVIDIPSHLETFDGVQADLSTFALDPTYPPPQHGTLSFDSSSGLLTYTPDFGYTGFDSINYVISDTTGFWHSFANIFVLIQPTATPRLQSDPLGGQMLVVDGTVESDTILITPGKRHGDVIVSINGVNSGPFRPTSRVVIFGYGGNDHIQVSDRLHLPTWLVGGTGNDTLIAGGGPSILLGGIGNDTLTSGHARDLLIGGTGADTLNGTGNDILIAGTTSFDTNQPALNAIQREWNSQHSYSQRILNLTGQINKKSVKRLNGDTFLTFASVQDDASIDIVDVGGNKSLQFTSTGDIVMNSKPPKPKHSKCEPNYRCGAHLAHADLACNVRGDKVAGKR